MRRVAESMLLRPRSARLRNSARQPEPGSAVSVAVVEHPRAATPVEDAWIADHFSIPRTGSWIQTNRVVHAFPRKSVCGECPAEPICPGRDVTPIRVEHLHAVRRHPDAGTCNCVLP